MNEYSILRQWKSILRFLQGNHIWQEPVDYTKIYHPNQDLDHCRKHPCLCFLRHFEKVPDAWILLILE